MKEIVFVTRRIKINGQQEIVEEFVAEKAKAQGVKVRLSIYENMFHVFQMGMTLMPESKKAWVEVSKFLEQLMIF